jgi:hypothetical protein
MRIRLVVPRADRATQQANHRAVYIFICARTHSPPSQFSPRISNRAHSLFNTLARLVCDPLSSLTQLLLKEIHRLHHSSTLLLCCATCYH